MIESQDTEVKQAFIQGTPEWLALRKTKITATDSNIIMGKSKWKTPLQLYHEKLSDEPPMPPNARMQRGLDLEPLAREYFTSETGIKLIPKDDPRNVKIHPGCNWMMASFDGVSECGKYTVEIKCPGQDDHETALAGKIPDHYYAQNMHQMIVAHPEKHFYLSFDGKEGPIIEVKTDYGFAHDLIDEVYNFYLCLIKKTPPNPTDRDFVQVDDGSWRFYSEQWRHLQKQKKEIEAQEEKMREEIIQLCEGKNVKGPGITVTHFLRKGNIDYGQIEALKKMNLEIYRKPPTTSWRITQ